MKREQPLVLLWQLFSGFLRIGAFTFGGGFAMLPLIKREIVTTRHWLGDEDFIDAIGIAQTSPGPIAVNTAVLCGYRIAALPGAFAAALGVVLPSFVVIYALTSFLLQYQNATWLQAIFMGVRPAIFAQIAVAALDVGKSALRTVFTWVLAAVALILLVFDVHPIIIIVVAAAIGVGRSRLGGRKERQTDDRS